MSFNRNDQNQFGYIDEYTLAQAVPQAMQQTYNWMGLGLLLTAAVAWFSQDLAFERSASISICDARRVRHRTGHCVVAQRPNYDP